ncbi:MAG: tryptophan 2,3-dioxygenase [Bacteroidetes bacterium]|nr:tryptophan 2,3-dioxygenase [Bacteroidota bacterium]
MSNVYYPDYLQLDTILGAQAPESDKAKVEAHDELLFIIIHQTYELWFKQVLHEVGSVVDIFKDGHVDDNSGELNIAVHRLHRVTVILQTLVKQLDILETMTPLDFLDFRDLLRPASGFQSMQFKVIEATLGLRMEQRHGKQYYTSQLRPEHKAMIEALEGKPTLLDLVNAWLERMPFLDPRYWPGEASFWDRLKATYESSLAPEEKGNMKAWAERFEEEVPGRRLSPAAARNAVFIMLYRDEPIFQQAFRFLDVLLDIDEQLATWRSRHLSMVRRMIGVRMGTGGSTGSGYLKGALDSHFIFNEIAELSSFLIDRHRLPKLPDGVRTAMAFHS